jgi:hypothetical protein
MPLLVVPTEPHMIHLAWSVRRLTPLQKKYVVEFFGEAALRLFEDDYGGRRVV